MCAAMGNDSPVAYLAGAPFVHTMGAQWGVDTWAIFQI